MLGARRVDQPAKEPLAGPLDVFLNELPELVDNGDRVEVTLALRLAPREQPVSAEDNAVAGGFGLDGFA